MDTSTTPKPAATLDEKGRLMLGTRRITSARFTIRESALRWAFYANKAWVVTHPALPGSFFVVRPVDAERMVRAGGDILR